MGTFAGAKRQAINLAFEARSGDTKGDVEPAFIASRRDGKDVVTCEVRPNGDTLEVSYRILDPALDDADVARIFHIAYLDVFTSHYWHEKTRPQVSQTKLKLSNSESGFVSTVPYPDPE